MRAVGRIFATLLGFMAAVTVAAGFFMAAKVGIEPTTAETAGWFWGQFFVYGGLTAAVVGSLAFVPFVVYALLTEMLGLRSVVIHAGAWGLFAFACSLAFDGFQRGDTTLHADRAVMLATGFVAGLAYWLVAGRGAGLTDATAPAERLPPPSRDTTA